MPDLSLKGLDEGLMRSVKVAASVSGVTLREWVVNVLTRAIANKVEMGTFQTMKPGGGTAGRKTGTADTGPLEGSAGRAVGEAGLKGARKAPPVTGAETLVTHAGSTPAPATNIVLATKYDGSPDLCPYHRIQLVVISGSQTQCPQCKEKFKRMAR